MSIIVCSEDRDTAAVHCHLYEGSFCLDSAGAEHQVRYPNDFCLNVDHKAYARGYPTPTVYVEEFSHV